MGVSPTPNPPPLPAKDAGDAILRVRGLSRSFRMGDQRISILREADLTVRKGEFLAIEGRSGSGKSTLLHILGALDSPDAGVVEYKGRQYAAPSSRGWMGLPDALVWLLSILALAAFTVAQWLIYRSVVPALAAHFSLLAAVLVTGGAILGCLGLWSYRHERFPSHLRNSEFGFVFQFYHLLPELNVLENAVLPSLTRLSFFQYFTQKGRLRRKAMELLDKLGLGHRLRHKPSQLSGGERQRVAIARALMNDPQVLFADEPTGNLDADTGRQIMSLIEKLHAETGQTIVMVTHDRTLAAEADRVLLLKDGKLVAEKR